MAGPYVYRGPDGLPGRVVDYQGRQGDLDPIPGNIFFRKMKHNN